ncbi:InlB B-repeat-containing protein [Bilifractor sp. LCP19S3_H10]|uniref:InlB B-repeat-containing protein n=1 Tax=Bilifractor sp. LCP19S3_H10 TaxID=3438736 RepID=UPI003F92CA2D
MRRRKEDIMRGGILRLLVLVCFAIAGLILFRPVKAEAATNPAPFTFRWEEGTHELTLFFNRNNSYQYIQVGGEQKYITNYSQEGTFVISPCIKGQQDGWNSSLGYYWNRGGYQYNTAVKYKTAGTNNSVYIQDGYGNTLVQYNPPPNNTSQKHAVQSVTVHLTGNLNETKTVNLDSGTAYGWKLVLKSDGIHETYPSDTRIYSFARSGYRVIGFGFSKNDVGNTNQKENFTYFNVNNQIYVKYQINPDFDLQDGSHDYGKILHGTVDVWANGKQIRNDVRDYHERQNYNTQIVIKDIKPDPGYHYDGPSEYKATITTDTAINVTGFHPNTYTVKYDGNGATDGFMNDQTATYDAEFVTRQNAFSKTGYDFNGWNEKADGSGTAWGFNNYGVYENGNGTKPWQWTYLHDITLYAQWKYNVVFDPNLDSVSTVGDIVNTGMPSAANPLVCHYQQGQKLPSNTYSIYGYTFAGWSTNKTDVNAQYADGATILSNPTPNNGDTVTLYAIWKINNYPITYKLQKDSDAETDMPGTVSLANKKTVVYPAHGGLYFENPRLTNEKFTGWTCAELGSTDKTKDLTISSDQIKTWYEAKKDKHDNVGITLVAHFEAVPPFEFVDSKTGQTPILNETEKNQGKFRVEEVESSPGYIYEDQYHDIDIHDNDDTHEYQDSDYRNLTFPEKNGK